jgi:5-methyltetrahydrofolate--homocysteine methyltransferase
MNIRKMLDTLAAERILVLDGAMGTMIQAFRTPAGQPLGEEDFRGQRFTGHRVSLLGCNDLLCLTKPEVVYSIHEAYLKAGADIIETCSFNASSVSLEDFGLGHLAYEISAAAAGLARKAADTFSTPAKKRFVAGSMGPTAKSASLSPDIGDPGRRGISFDELAAAYYDNARGLMDGGADLLLIETVFDTLNAKAAIFAIKQIEEERHIDIPLMISATVAGPSGRLLSGQTLEAFCVSVLHGQPWSIGLNCSFGAEKLKVHAAKIAALAPCLTSVHPNAGMPNQFGAYDESPESMAVFTEAYLAEGLVNIIGGCCGTTPEHIAAIAAKVPLYQPRRRPAQNAEAARRRSFLAGLEALTINGENKTAPLMYIGERTNVAGSRKFLRLIKEEKYAEALGIARQMIEDGAAIINICMDDALLDTEKVMTSFLTLALSDPGIAKAPFMIDSSRWNVIARALKYIQGKALVNSISLKDGEEEFLRRARFAQRCGAAVVVMLFDEKGQAAEYTRKIETAGRSYRLLTENGFPPEDIVFDPNVLSIATGIPEHDSYALDFIRACTWIRENCPGARISGGISNLSFSFRGNDTVREAMHGVFLKHAVDAGLNMAIVNPGTLVPYDRIDPVLRQAVEDVICCRNSAGTVPAGQSPVDRLVALAAGPAVTQPGIRKNRSSPGPSTDWRNLPLEERIIHAIVKGIDDYIETDVLELRPRYGRALDMVENLLMKGMEETGDQFGQGTMFLPQVIRSARVMKKAVTVLEPFIEREKVRPGGMGAAKTARAGKSGAKIILATVKGDVHDIGKNIVGLVLACNGHTIVDLGVMTPAEHIVEAVLREKADMIGLSGLISPSLDEMIVVARELENQGIKIPILIGGAAASLAHTGLRIAPEYSGPVVYVSDAGKSAETVRSLLSKVERSRFLESLEARYQAAALRHEKIKHYVTLLPLRDARKNKIPSVSYIPVEPKQKNIIELRCYPPEKVIPYLNWHSFLQTWDLAEETYPSAYTVRVQQERQKAREKLLEEAQALLDQIIQQGTLQLRGLIGFYPAVSRGDDILAGDPEQGEPVRFCFPRNQEKKLSAAPNPCLADFILPSKKGRDWIGLFALSAGFGLTEAAAAYREKNDDYRAILLASLANTLTEAFSEAVHLRVRREWWGYAPDEDLSSAEILKGRFQGIRPAFGYPACPDHRDKEIVFHLLDARRRCGFELTETAMIIPAASVCGMYFASPGSYYFGVGRLEDDQIKNWAGRKKVSPREIQKRLGRI